MAFKVYAESHATVMYLYDVIDENWGIAPSAVVRAIDDAKMPIEMRINSPGGDVFGGLAITNALKACRYATTAIIDGIAASAASVVATGADEVEMKAGSEWFLHKAWTFTAGNDDDHEKALKPLRDANKSLVAEYVRKTGQTEETAMGWIKDETYFNVDEALAVGLADRRSDEMGVAALVPPQLAAMFANAPSEMKMVAQVSPEWFPKSKPDESAKYRQEANARKLRIYRSQSSL